MMKPVLVLTVVLCMGLYPACVDDTVQSIPSEAVPTGLDRPVPFKATLRGGGPPPTPSAACPGLLLTELTARGIASHFGSITASQRHCLNPSTFTFNNGVLDYVAANGDHVVGTYSGSLAPTPDPAIVEIIGAWQFSGGTGRFSNAAGTGTASGRLDVTTGEFILVLDGTLAF